MPDGWNYKVLFFYLKINFFLYFTFTISCGFFLFFIFILMQKNSLCNRDRGSMIGMASIFQPREQFLNMGNTVKKESLMALNLVLLLIQLRQSPLVSESRRLEGNVSTMKIVSYLLLCVPFSHILTYSPVFTWAHGHPKSRWYFPVSFAGRYGCVVNFRTMR